MAENLLWRRLCVLVFLTRLYLLVQFQWRRMEHPGLAGLLYNITLLKFQHSVNYFSVSVPLPKLSGHVWQIENYRNHLALQKTKFVICSTKTFHHAQPPFFFK